MPRRRHLLAAGLFAPTIARAQSFPSRPLRIVVPVTPGGANDLIARQVGERLSSVLGQPAVIDNRPGAGGNLGAEAVAKSTPDGHTMLLTSASLIVGNKWLYGAQMPIDPIRDLAPVTRIAYSTILLVANAQRPWRSFAELIADARARPGQITLGSSGTGQMSHLYLERLKREAGVDIVHVPYRGGAPAIADLVAGTVDLMFDAIPALLPHVRDGRFRPLAAGSAGRITWVPELTEVPGMDEVMPGHGIDALNWYSVTVPTGTPRPAIDVLYRALVRVMADPDFGARLRPQSFLPLTDPSPEAFLAYWREQEGVWRELVERSGAKVD
ncbi:MAG: Tripartite-type tricarboxylate transporter, receptor component TctC [Rubritepida sp.]|nr:Tripartite-type tricarboxylate transporter, receptor component TctC [Rubritepida sp.]